jgi:hypothetical protein
VPESIDRTCLRVSKQWHAFLASQPRLWKIIDMTKKRQRRKILPEALRKYARYSQNNLTALLLGSFDHTNTVVNILRCCKHLGILSIGPKSDLGGESILKFLRYSNQLRSLLIGVPVRNSYIYDIFSTMPQLEELRFLGLDPGPTKAGENAILTFPIAKAFSNMKIFELAGQCNTHKIDSANFERVRLP